MSAAYADLTSIQPITFEEFWEAYPKRQAKKDAEKAWNKVKPAHHQFILEAIRRQIKTDQWQRGIIPLPATWLRGERWFDEDKPRLNAAARQNKAGPVQTGLRRSISPESDFAE